MYLVSEDEYIAMGKHPEQQQRLNAIALQDEHNVHTADKQEVSDEGHERKLEFHDTKYLHAAPKAFTTDKKDDAEETI